MTSTTGNIELFWQNESSECFCKNNLIFVNILKNASSFYRDVFVTNKWNFLKFENVNWEDNYVFGFIQHPVVRYCKGLTEDLYENLDLSGKILPLLSDNIKNFLPLTFHTLPISMTCGDRMYQMTWFPLDADTSSKQQLDDFCRGHNVFLNWNFNFNLHSSNPKKINFFNNVKFLLGNGNHIFWKVFAKDMDLYNKVICNQKNLSISDHKDATT